MLVSTSIQIESARSGVARRSLYCPHGANLGVTHRLKERVGEDLEVTLPLRCLSLRGSSRVEAAVVVVASSNSVAYVYIYRACITGYVKLQDRIFSFVCCFCGSLRSACVFPFYLLLVLACCFLFVCAFAFQFSCFFAFPLLCLAFSASWIAK